MVEVNELLDLTLLLPLAFVFGFGTKLAVFGLAFGTKLALLALGRDPGPLNGRM